MIPNAAPSRFAVCPRNDDYPVCLERRKVYRVLPDEAGARHGSIRVVGETEEDCLYPAEFFHLLDLPQEIGRALAGTSE
jgi:hypothetical protein